MRATLGALLAAIVIAVGVTPSYAARNCTNAELRRISDSWTIDCFSHRGAQVKCQSNGDPLCCWRRRDPWGRYTEYCTSSPSYIPPGRVDPGSGPKRPPRAGNPDMPPNGVSPP